MFKARIRPAILVTGRALFVGPVFLSIVASSSEQSSSSLVDHPIFRKVIVQVPTLTVLLFAGNDWTSIVRVAFTSTTFGDTSVCVSVSEFEPVGTFATNTVLVNVEGNAAKAAGVI